MTEIVAREVFFFHMQLHMNLAHNVAYALTINDEDEIVNVK